MTTLSLEGISPWFIPVYLFVAVLLVIIAWQFIKFFGFILGIKIKRNDNNKKSISSGRKHNGRESSTL